MRSECLEHLTREERIRLAVLRSAGALIEAEMTEEEVRKIPGLKAYLEACEDLVTHLGYGPARLFWRAEMLDFIRSTTGCADR
jgi:hypothetical protein